MRLEISCQDRLGITQDVLDILVTHEIDLRGIEIDETGKIFLNFPNIEFADFQHLMPKIRRIDGISDVKTTHFMPSEREKLSFLPYCARFLIRCFLLMREGISYYAMKQ